MRSASKALWLLALVAGVVGGIGFGVANARGVVLPRRIEYVVAALASIGGCAFGVRAVWLPAATLGAFGLASFLVESISPSQGEDQRAVVLVVALLLGLLLMAAALVGAAIRGLVERLIH